MKSSDTPVADEELNDPVTDITAETQNDPAIIDPIVKEDTTQKIISIRKKLSPLNSLIKLFCRLKIPLKIL